MDTDEFKDIYNESRNGTDGWTRHPLCRRLVYSDGVRELAELGCYWLLDVIGTEFVKAAAEHQQDLEGLGFIYVDVSESSAVITLKRDHGEPILYRRDVSYTDMPEGLWIFYFAQGDGYWMLHLPSEY